MPSDQVKISSKEKFAYGLGDAAANFVFQTQITFLLFFYTNVLGIASGMAGTILLISRSIDACSDPIVGVLADRTQSRWGHYRPWLLWTAVPLAIAFVLCYTTPQWGPNGTIVWAFVTYNVLMVIYAANNIPYCALSGVITDNANERTSLAAWRFVCAMAATLVVNMFTLRLITAFGQGDEARGYQLVAAVWGAIVVVLLLVTFAFTRERVRPYQKHNSSLWQDATDLLRNKPWIVLFVLAMLIHVELALRGGGMLYYFKYHVEANDIFTWIDNFGLFNGVGLVVTLIGVSLSKPLAQVLGRRKTFQACMALTAVFMALFAAVPRDSFATLLVLQVLLQFAFGPTIPILWAMMADVVDYSEWRTGRRSTALAFASLVFGMKVGLGIGGWLNGQMLASFGYSAEGPISSAAQRGIVSIVSILPAAALLAGSVLLCFYRLDDIFMDDIASTLAARRGRKEIYS